MWFRVAAVCAVAVQVTCAQTWEITPYTSFVKFSSKGIGSLNAVPTENDTKVKGIQPGYGFRLTANTHGYYGVEIGYSRNRASLSTSVIPLDSEEDNPAAVVHSTEISVHQASLNGICYFMPNGERFRPYVTAGGQLAFWSNPRFTDWTIGKSRNMGVNYGGGLKIRLNKNLNIRLEARGITTGKPYGLSYPDDANEMPRSPGWLNQFESTIGVGFTF